MGKLTVLLVKAVQELSSQVTELKKNWRIKKLIFILNRGT